MRDLLNTLVPILLLMAGIFATTTVFVFLRSDARPTVKFMLVPASLLAAVLVPMLFVLLMGYSVPLPPPDSFVLIGHKTIIVENKKKFIELWTYERGTNATRLYQTPWSKELEELLNEAAKGKSQGLEAHLKRRGKKDKKQGDGSENNDRSPFTMELLAPSDLSPKELPDQPRPPTPDLPDDPRFKSDPKFTT
jgi:hypothetical protein